MGKGKSFLNYYPDSEDMIVQVDKFEYLGIKETFAKAP